MKYSARISITLFLLIFVAGCSLFRSQSAGSLFIFDYEGKTYEIAGYNNSTEGESANFLIQRMGDDVILRVMDRNRTGVLDRVITGDISIQEANNIYQEGIRIAIHEDQFESLSRERTFNIRSDDYRLVVESYLKLEDQFQNRFIIYDLHWVLLGIYWDEESDGIIDRFDTGELAIDKVQELYTVALQEAQEEGKLQDSDDNQFIISQKSSDKSELAGFYD